MRRDPDACEFFGKRPVVNCTKIAITRPLGMDVGGSLYGFGEGGEERRVTFAALAQAVAAISRLDAEPSHHSLRSVWLRVGREVSLAAAARETGLEADLLSNIATRLGSLTLLRGHV